MFSPSTECVRLRRHFRPQTKFVMPPGGAAAECERLFAPPGVVPPVPSCEQPSLPHGAGNAVRAYARRCAPGATGLRAKPPSDLRAATLPWSLEIVSWTFRRGALAGPCVGPVAPDFSCEQTFFRVLAREALRPRGALWTVQWQSPAGANGRHVFLRGHGAFLRGRTRPPACLAIFLVPRPCALVPPLLLLALPGLLVRGVRFRPHKLRIE